MKIAEILDGCALQEPSPLPLSLCPSSRLGTGSGRGFRTESLSKKPPHLLMADDHAPIRRMISLSTNSFALPYFNLLNCLNASPAFSSFAKVLSIAVEFQKTEIDSAGGSGGDGGATITDYFFAACSRSLSIFRQDVSVSSSVFSQAA